jgi:uncharacterized protein (DUF952 family)
MSLPRIYHLALPADWAQAQRTGTYTTSTRGRTLAEEGYIHCSHPGQTDGVAARFYADVPDLLLLTIDLARLDAPVREEDLHGAGEDFPHVYGPIPVDAVVEVRPYRAADSVAPVAPVAPAEPAP